MRALLIASVFMLVTQPLQAGSSDSEACREAEKKYAEQGMTMKDCLCMMGEAGKHMTPPMKEAFVASLMAQQANPMSQMMAAGISLQDLMTAMQAYVAGLEKNCGLK